MSTDSLQVANSTGVQNGAALSGGQIELIVAFERAGASLSIFGLILIFVAYGFFKRLRTVPNTFIVFASFANLGASVACLIGYAGISDGKGSSLCQAQAFMFELFMQSDPWWSFAMAVNVYMVFFFSATPANFLDYWWAYFLVCYGIPFIPALWLLLIRGSDVRGGSALVYGDATIWCWINSDWSNLRIYTYYLPIWVCILLSTCIYFAVGYYVFKQRNQLRNLSFSNTAREEGRDPEQESELQERSRDSGEKTLFANAAVMGRVNTEVTQTTSLQAPPATASEDGPRSPAAIVNWFDSPIGANSLASRRPDGTSSASGYQTVTRITAEPKRRTPVRLRLSKAYNRWCAKFSHMDPVKLAYLRTSFVFAISVLVTWTPSSINRVHDILYQNNTSFGLNLASSIVLPLQGIWNAVIFFSTSSRALREEFGIARDRWQGLPRGHRAASAVRDENQRAVELERRIGRKPEAREDGDSSRSGSTMRVMRDSHVSLPSV